MSPCYYDTAQARDTAQFLLLPSSMARFSSIAVLALFFGILGQAQPIDEQVALVPEGTVHITDSWSYTDCGKLELRYNLLHPTHRESRSPHRSYPDTVYPSITRPTKARSRLDCHRQGSGHRENRG